MVTRYGKLKLGIVYQFTYMLSIYNNNKDNNYIIIINSSNNNNNNNNNNNIYIYIRYTNMFPSRKWAELNHGSSGWGRLLVRGERDSATRRMHRMSGVCENVWCIEFVSTLALIYIYLLYLIICWCSYYNPSHIYIYINVYKCIAMCAHFNLDV
jgi:hypothetical protein